MPTPTQPTITIELGEYELQVLEAITKHAIDAGVLRTELLEVVAAVKAKIQDGRTELAIARRRLAVATAQQRKGQV